MSRALVLACGNPLRGDDAVALHIANCLRNGLCDPRIHVRFDQQWAPELAESISEAEVVIFVDASENVAPGQIVCDPLQPSHESSASLTHQTSPSSLLALSKDLYGRQPARAYLLAIGGVSFDLQEGLSEPVRHAIPVAIERIKALLCAVASPQQ